MKHRSGKQRDLILTNILEEGSTVDEPRSFEQDERYLDECLKVLDGNPESLQVHHTCTSLHEKKHFIIPKSVSLN